jgi:hypothetical protein
MHNRPLELRFTLAPAGGDVNRRSGMKKARRIQFRRALPFNKLTIS